MLLGELGRPWGLDLAIPKGVAEGSRFHHEKEFKDRHAAEWMSNRNRKVQYRNVLKSTFLRSKSG